MDLFYIFLFWVDLFMFDFYFINILINFNNIL